MFWYKRSFEPSSAKFGFNDDTIFLNFICVFSLGQNRCVIIWNALTNYKIRKQEWQSVILNNKHFTYPWRIPTFFKLTQKLKTFIGIFQWILLKFQKRCCVQNPIYFMAPINESLSIASSLSRKWLFQKTMPEGMSGFYLSGNDGKNMEKLLLKAIFQNYCPCNICTPCS